MRDHLYLFFFMIHFSTGCILSGESQAEITAYTGGSVLLPCSCADPQSTANTLAWKFDRRDKWIQVLEDEKYSGRRVLFNEGSPSNLSLLISDIRKEDEGYYQCVTEQHISTSIWVTVKGCDLVQNINSTPEVLGYSGESVVLPCSCTELLAKPEHIRWKYYRMNNYVEIYPNEESERHKNRVKLLHQTTPGNLSLHISALTAEHEGDYLCSVSPQASSSSSSSYRLHIKEKPHIQTVGLSTHQPSHQTQELTPPQQPQHTPLYVFIMSGLILSVLLLALLALIYWRCRGGRNVKKETSDDEELNRKQDYQDDVTYSAVVHIKRASTPAHTQSNSAEDTEYAPI